MAPAARKLTASDHLKWWSGPTLDIVPDWIERHCVVPDGDFDAFGHKPAFVLRDYQLCFVTNHYAVRPKAKPTDKSGAFVHQLSVLIDSQKKGKSPLVAAVILVEAVGPALFAGWAKGGEQWVCEKQGCDCGWVYTYSSGEPMARRWTAPLIQVTANSEAQTGNTYDALRPMIDYGPLTSQIPHTGEEVIRLPGGKACQIVPVTAKATSRLGARVTFVPWDEAALYYDEKMWKVYRTQKRGLTAMGGRGVITTNPDDPATDNVVKDLIENPSKDVYIQWTPPPPSLKWSNKADRRQILRFNYTDAPWVLNNLAGLESDIEQAMRRDPAEAERFYGNRRVQGAGHWLAEEPWLGKESPREVPDGTPIVIAGDLSNNNDWTGIRAMTAEGYQFTPTYGPSKAPTVWQPNGPGGLIPRGEVRAAVDELEQRYHVVRAYWDPAGSARGISAEADAMEVVEDDSWLHELKAWQARYQTADGKPRHFPWPTHVVSKIHPVLEAFRQAVNGPESDFQHDGCPTTKAHILNAIMRARTGQRYILGKPNENQKIDMAMSSVLCAEAWADAIANDEFSGPEDEYVYVF
jgi:hypothetical protein